MKQLYSRQYPKSHLLNPARDYTHSTQTDIRETFEKAKAQQAKQQNKVRRVK